jgi:hypothetical protein
MPVWLVIIFAILGTALVLKLFHALAIVAVHPVTQGAMYTSTGRVKIRAALEAVPMRPGRGWWTSVRRRPGPSSGEKTLRVACLGFESTRSPISRRRSHSWGEGIEIRYRISGAPISRDGRCLVLSLPDVMRRLGGEAGRRARGRARVVSFNFPIPGWKPQRTLRAASKLHNDRYTSTASLNHCRGRTRIHNLQHKPSPCASEVRKL